MSSFTTQQTKLDLEPVPKEKRLDIRKCNERLNPGKIQREPTFQVVLDALALTPCYSAFLITADVPEVYMHQFWDSVYKHDTFYRFKIDKRKRFKLTLEVFRDIFKICPRVQGQEFDALPTDEEIVSFLRDLGHTGEIHSLNDVFKKSASLKLTTIPASTEEPIGKSKIVKRPAKKSTQALAKGVVIRETSEIPVSKKKEKVDVARGKGIELLSDVALTEEAKYEEVRKNILRDFHKTHPSGSGIATKPTPSAVIIKPSITNKGTGVKPGVPDVTEKESSKSEADDDDKSQSDNKDESDFEHETDDNESGSESDQEEDDEKIENDEEEEEEEIFKTPSNDSDETKMKQRLLIKLKGSDATMTNVQQGNENPEISQVIEDAHVTLSTVLQKAKIPYSSSSRSSDLAAKFLNFLDIPTIEAEIVSPLDVPVHHEVPSQQIPTLLTVSVLVISKSSPVISTVIPQSLQSFTPPPLLSTPIPPLTTKAINSPSTLPDFASVFQFNNRVTTLEQEVVKLC
ncbi:hypothetical protein Tco_0073252 [Tanacetum coccineum]